MHDDRDPETIRGRVHRHAAALPHMDESYVPRVGPVRIRSTRMPAPPAIAWLNPDDADSIVAVLNAAGLDLCAVGTPERGQSTRLAERLGTEPIPDLRAAVASTSAKLALLAAVPEGLDARTVLAADARGLRFVATGPAARSLADLAETGLLKEHAGKRASDLIRLAPRPRYHPVFRAAAEVIEAFGRFGHVSIECNAPGSAGGLRAAVFAAIDSSLALIGTPELADATASRPLYQATESDHVAALLRFPDGRSGQLTATAAGLWSWRATLLGPEGRLTIRPSGFDWLGPDGARRDEHRAGRKQTEFGVVLSQALVDVLDPNSRRGPGPDWISLHAVADAAELSARTGQPESPSTIVRATMPSG